MIDAFMIIKGKLQSGAEIRGETLDKEMRELGAFEIHSFDWGVKHAASGESGEDTDEESEKKKKEKKKAKNRPVLDKHGLQIEEFTISKYLDTATPMLFLACCQYPELDSARVLFRKAGGGSSKGTPHRIVFADFTFTFVRVDSIDWDFGDEQQKEKIKFKFMTCQITYIPQAVTGGVSEAKKVVFWDMSKKKEEKGEQEEEENLDLSQLFGDD